MDGPDHFIRVDLAPSDIVQIGYRRFRHLQALKLLLVKSGLKLHELKRWAREAILPFVEG
jgi:hypothetical protein